MCIHSVSFTFYHINQDSFFFIILVGVSLKAPLCSDQSNSFSSFFLHTVLYFVCVPPVLNRKSNWNISLFLNFSMYESKFFLSFSILTITFAFFFHFPSSNNILWAYKYIYNNEFFSAIFFLSSITFDVFFALCSHLNKFNLIDSNRRKQQHMENLPLFLSIFSNKTYPIIFTSQFIHHYTMECDNNSSPLPLFPSNTMIYWPTIIVTFLHFFNFQHTLSTLQHTKRKKIDELNSNTYKKIWYHWRSCSNYR